MKKAFKIFLVMISLGLLFSCSKDDSLDPRPVLVSGQYVRYDIKDKVLNSDNLAISTFGGVISAPGGKVVKYNMYVRLFDGSNPSTDFKLLKEITTFPVDAYFTGTEIAAALQIPLSQIATGNRIGFYGESFDADGKRADFSNLSAVIAANSAAYKQAYRFNCSVQFTTNYTPFEFEVIDNWEGQ